MTSINVLVLNVFEIRKEGVSLRSSLLHQLICLGSESGKVVSFDGLELHDDLGFLVDEAVDVRFFIIGHAIAIIVHIVAPVGYELPCDERYAMLERRHRRGEDERVCLCSFNGFFREMGYGIPVDVSILDQEELPAPGHDFIGFLFLVVEQETRFPPSADGFMDDGHAFSKVVDFMLVLAVGWTLENAI